ncbi:hypothetical protein BBP40_003125 [Aspergillus hancockii]|nr:hypothetical protein BBP40_003125 [Aspergillus hancockii]
MATPKAILITGPSGFVAAHVIEAFISAGYHVRGTVRSRVTAEKVRRTFPQYTEQLSFAIVPNIVEDDAFDEAVKGVHGNIHTAYPTAAETENNERDIVQPAINGTINMLKATKQYAPQVKAAWGFVSNGKTSFDLVTILPPMIYGPNINAAHASQLNITSVDIYRFMSSEAKPTDPVPENGFWSWVDARDVALAHLKAYEVPAAGGERFFVCAGNYSYQQIADILREKVPGVKNRVPLGKPGVGFGGVEVYTPDAEKSRKILGLEYQARGSSLLGLDSLVRPLASGLTL